MRERFNQQEAMTDLSSLTIHQTNSCAAWRVILRREIGTTAPRPAVAPSHLFSNRPCASMREDGFVLPAHRGRATGCRITGCEAIRSRSALTEAATEAATRGACFGQPLSRFYEEFTEEHSRRKGDYYQP
jgi:hypothetical protein